MQQVREHHTRRSRADDADLCAHGFHWQDLRTSNARVGVISGISEISLP
jgi:hypothetical protein